MARPARWSVGVLVACLGWVTLAAAPPSQAAIPLAATGPRATGLTLAVAISDNGHLALGTLGAQWVVRDLDSATTVRTLPSTSAYSYVGLSGDGRTVAYSRLSSFHGCRVPIPKVRNRVTNKSRWVATDRRGHRLRPAWRSTTCTREIDDEKYTDMPSFSPPAISANGRYVAFCANLRVPGRIDLYVKDLRRGKLTRRDGACAPWTEDGVSGFQAPQISATGRVVLAPGTVDAEYPGRPWGPYQLLVGATLRSGLVGDDPQLTRSGLTVFAGRPLGACPTTASTCPTEPTSYDVASGVTTALPPGTPQSGAMSTTGQMRVSSSWPSATMSLAVFDRATATAVDLVPALAAAGLTPNDSSTGTGGTWSWTAARPLISGDGRRVLVHCTDNLEYLLDWQG